jgi:predicted amidophosphoribosyltransferase
MGQASLAILFAGMVCVSCEDRTQQIKRPMCRCSGFSVSSARCGLRSSNAPFEALRVDWMTKVIMSADWRYWPKASYVNGVDVS